MEDRLLRRFSSSVELRRVGRRPRWATEMLPVSSLTTMANASVAWDMPRAERWRRPRARGTLVSWLTGRMQPAALILPPSIIMAPS